MQVTLPWPDRRLSPNARLHWRRVAPVKAAAKRDAYLLALEAGLHRQARDRGLHLLPGIAVGVTFAPPDGRRRDADNMLACCKAALDGVSAALAIDDSKWTLTINRSDPVKGGAVIIEIMET